MVMTSEGRSINLDSVPLQSFQLSTMTTAEKVALKKKLKMELASVKLATKRIEAEHGRKSCRFDLQDHLSDKVTTRMSKSYPDSDGAVSGVDEEHACPVSQCAASAKAPDDCPLSPTKVVRVAMLKRRFAETIRKAEQEMLLNHGEKVDLSKAQQQRKRLERKQHEEKERIEAKIRAAKVASRLKAETELKIQRYRERAAARVALQKMEKTVDIDENQWMLRDLERFGGCSLTDNGLDSKDKFEVVVAALESGGELWNPLERLGLFLKDDWYIMEEEEEKDKFEVVVAALEGVGQLGNPLEQLGLFLKDDWYMEEEEEANNNLNDGDLEEGEICS